MESKPVPWQAEAGNSTLEAHWLLNNLQDLK